MQHLLSEGLAASIGGGVATLTLYPLDALRTKLAATEGKTSAWSVLRDVVRTQGLAGLFSGVTPKVAQSMLGKFLYFCFFTGLLRLRGPHGSLLTELACGYLAEAMHLPLTIPLEVVVTRIQKGGSGSVAGTVRALVADRGLAGLWTGWCRLSCSLFCCRNPS